MTATDSEAATATRSRTFLLFASSGRAASIAAAASSGTATDRA